MAWYSGVYDTKCTNFPPYHSVIQTFQYYNFSLKEGLWRLGLRSVVLVEQKEQYIILGEDKIKKVKIIHQVCPLIHCCKNPAHYLWWEMNQSLLELKEPGILMIQPSHFTDEYPGVHKGEVICPRLLCDESVSELAHCSPNSLQHNVGFSETTSERTNSSIWQPFKYLVTVLLWPQVSSSG